MTSIWTSLSREGVASSSANKVMRGLAPASSRANDTSWSRLVPGAESTIATGRFVMAPFIGHRALGLRPAGGFGLERGAQGIER